MSKSIELMKQIAAVLAGYDKQVLDCLIASIPARRKELANARKENYWLICDAYAYHAKLYDAVGGKAWLSLLDRGNADVADRLTKQEGAKAEARNAKLAAKLHKAGISEVTGFESSHSINGFTGRWSVETDKGTKHVFIEVVLAGGYNIQCLHHRVLVNVR